MEIEFDQLARDLTGRPVDQLVLCKSGRNSRVYKVVCGDAVYALKSYPPQEADTRDRFGTEIRALQFYAAHDNPYTARLLAVQPGVALMQWMAGEVPLAPDMKDMDQALDFIARTHAARANGEGFGLAAEPCLCGADLYRHITQRLEKLRGLPELHDFLTQEIAPLLQRARHHAENSDFATPLAMAQRSLIPADFGFHNALKSADGHLAFIDFEYFGWDDPVRLTADFLLHPGIALDEARRDRFLQGMGDIYREDGQFEARLSHLLPLYGLRWVLILLNEFLPERWQARVFAGESGLWQEIKAAQLKKARMAADKVSNRLKLS